MAPSAGAKGSAELVVGEADTAIAAGSGDVPVLATPRVLALAERATVAALAGALAPGQTSVGASVELDHLRPSFVGARVLARATLTDVRGRRLTFAVEIAEGAEPVARATVTRVVVDRRGPGVPSETHPGDPLPGPAGDDRLTGRVPGGVVVEAALRAALGVAARPGGHVDREHQPVGGRQAADE